MYFLFGSIGRYAPPAANHPEFYYGFIGVALVWQAAFFMIASDPVRFRPMMIPAVLEKLSYVLTVVVLCLQHRLSPEQAIPAVPDAILGVLFTMAFFKATPRQPWRRGDEESTGTQRKPHE
jgi:hypothetical protein